MANRICRSQLRNGKTKYGSALGLTEQILARCKVHLAADYAHPAQRIIIMGFTMWLVLLVSSDTQKGSIVLAYVGFWVAAH